MEDSIKECEYFILNESKIIKEGKIIDEIGGSHGLHYILLELLKQFGIFDRKEME